MSSVLTLMSSSRFSLRRLFSSSEFLVAFFEFFVLALAGEVVLETIFHLLLR